MDGGWNDAWDDRRGGPCDGLLPRAARTGEELTYAPIANAVLHGPRPPKLPKRRRTAPRPAPH